MINAITGGAGYLGSVLVRKMFQAMSETDNYHTYHNEFDPLHNLKATEIVVYDNLMYKQVSLTDQCYRDNFKFVHGDVRDWDKLKKYVWEADVIIPLAAIVGFPACEINKQLATDVNYLQIKNIVDILRKDQKIVLPVTNSQYGSSPDIITEKSPTNPLSHYAVTKCDAEKYMLDSGNGISLRLATVFSISQRMRLDLLVNDFTYKAINDGYIVLFECKAYRNYIHIQDVALTFIYMINKYDKYNNQLFNVGLDENYNKLELCERIKLQVPEFVIKTDDFREDPDKRNYIVSNKKLQDTGWKTHYSVDDGIRELIKAYKIIQNNNRKFTNL